MSAKKAKALIRTELAWPEVLKRQIKASPNRLLVRRGKKQQYHKTKTEFLHYTFKKKGKTNISQLSGGKKECLNCFSFLRMDPYPLKCRTRLVQLSMPSSFTQKIFYSSRSLRCQARCITPSEGFSHHFEVLVMIFTAVPGLSRCKKV